MKDRFPRTPAEFRDHARIVTGQCRCGHTTWIKTANLIQRFGPDFDLYEGFDELRAALACEVCEGVDLAMAFRNPGQKAFGPVGFDAATDAALEMRAFAAARDANRPDGMKAMSPLGGGRYRKFGRR